MAEKIFILNADDFGMSKDLNRAVLEGCSYDILKSVSIVANGSAFEDALAVLQHYPDLGVGIHLNITEGLSLCEDIDLLTDEELHFNNNYWQLLVKAYNPKEKDFLPQLEREFRRQIEKILSKTNVTHIDSHQHIHTIPPIFELVCRLAKEYGIKQVRTHFEKPYSVPEISRHFCFQYVKNFFRTLVFSLFTIFNENSVHKYELKTNDYLIGLSYTSLMDALAVSYGVMAIKYDKVIVETVVHPCRYEDGTIDDRFKEYLLVKNKKLKEKIEKLGYIISNYAEK